LLGKRWGIGPDEIEENQGKTVRFGRSRQCATGKGGGNNRPSQRDKRQVLKKKPGDRNQKVGEKLRGGKIWGFLGERWGGAVGEDNIKFNSGDGGKI